MNWIHIVLPYLILLILLIFIETPVYHLCLLYTLFQAEQDLRTAQSEFDRQAEITKLLLEGISSTHVSTEYTKVPIWVFEMYNRVWFVVFTL